MKTALTVSTKKEILDELSHLELNRVLHAMSQKNALDINRKAFWEQLGNKAKLASATRQVRKND